MPIEYETVEGAAGAAHVLENDREQWQMWFEGFWYPYSQWQYYCHTIERLAFIKFRRQVSSELPL